MRRNLAPTSPAPAACNSAKFAFIAVCIRSGHHLDPDDSIIGAIVVGATDRELDCGLAVAAELAPHQLSVASERPGS